MEMEQHMLDIVGDENIDLVKKQRIMRWDKSKRKYIQTTVGDEASGMTQAKKVRLESGIQKAGKDMKLGQLYEKWQKKTNKSVGRAGVMDDFDADIEEARRENDGGSDKPKKQNPRWMTKEKMEQKKANKTQNQQEMKSRSELKKKKVRDEQGITRQTVARTISSTLTQPSPLLASFVAGAGREEQDQEHEKIRQGELCQAH